MQAILERVQAQRQRDSLASDHPALVSMRDTCALTSLSRTAINIRRANGTFPEAVRLGEKRVAFVRSEVLEWVRARIAERGRAA